MSEVTPFEGKSGKSDDLQSIQRQLEALSGKFVDVAVGYLGHFISNDSDYDAVRPAVSEHTDKDDRGGIGVFIGAGGFLSMLPELDLDMAIIIDKSPATLEFNRLLANYVLSSENPEEVIYRITSEEVTDDSPHLKECLDLYGGAGILPALEYHFRQEAQIYGDDHWTNPTLFPLVQERLRSLIRANVLADVGKKDFAAAFSESMRPFRRNITFANLTNVHNYLDVSDRDFVRSWPFSQRPTILLSGYFNSPQVQHPPMTAVGSVEDYMALVDKDPVDLRIEEDKKMEVLEELRSRVPTTEE